ncbi:hypothetical protein HDU92_007715 [Lobulomyces angularis]|nr:hypothetical protein HDU92_007715 [Lobulomyces angularis]
MQETYQDYTTEQKNGVPMELNPSNASIEESSDILLPNQKDHLNHIAVDIGGSLAKIVYYTNQPSKRLNFTKFETHQIDECLEFLVNLTKENNTSTISATGGGAHKFYEKFKTILNLKIFKMDEMECLITGLNFLVRQIPYEVFTFEEKKAKFNVEGLNEKKSIFPYMLVNIGSGVSIIKVTGENCFERVSGTSLGGGTLWGLLSLLTDNDSYDEMLKDSEEGDNKTVDMLVGDIYGGDYEKIGLKSTTIASSFGNVLKIPKGDRKNIPKEDISRSLLYLVSNNIAKLNNIERIYFSGFFIRGHPQTMHTLTFAINFWSKGKIQALFLRHEGYLGAMGAFLRHDSIMNKRLSLKPFIVENFSLAEKINDYSLTKIGALQTFTIDFSSFPKLLPGYLPDTTDLSDINKFNYWVDLLDKNLGGLVDLATKKGKEEANGHKFSKLYRNHLANLRENPYQYGVISVRRLLDLREQCLREMGFVDIFDQIKKDENENSLKVLPKFLKSLEEIKDEDTLITTLIENILGGNMYDWGSTSVLEMLKTGNFTFEKAKSKVNFPKKFNNRQELISNLKVKNRYKKCVIFCDNSGADILLGILPFTKFLLNKGTKVVLYLLNS